MHAYWGLHDTFKSPPLILCSSYALGVQLQLYTGTSHNLRGFSSLRSSAVKVNMGDVVNGGASFYRRKLPESCIALSSSRGKALFRAAQSAGCAEIFFSLVETISTQSDPAYCGLTSLTCVLNALSIDPCRVWKAPWRWFSEDMLDCCEPLDVVRERGITCEKLACLARCNGANAERGSIETTSLDEFRERIRSICSQDVLSKLLIASYSRKALGQTGSGHFSPIGAYEPSSDSVLILDVARFKYPPHFVKLNMLWEAMSIPDPATNSPRGFVELSKDNTTIPLTTSLIRIDAESYFNWPIVCKWLKDRFHDPPEKCTSWKSYASAMLTILNPEVSHFIRFVDTKNNSYNSLDREEGNGCNTSPGLHQALLRGIEQLPLFSEVQMQLKETADTDIITSEDSCQNRCSEPQISHITTMLLLSFLTFAADKSSTLYGQSSQSASKWRDVLQTVEASIPYVPVPYVTYERSHLASKLSGIIELFG